MENISFWTPLSFKEGTCFQKSLLKWSENYLSNGKKAEVISFDKGTISVQAPASTKPSSCLKTALKVASYFLIIPLITAFFIKAVYRWTYDVKVMGSLSPNRDKGGPTPQHTSTPPSQQMLRAERPFQEPNGALTDDQLIEKASTSSSLSEALETLSLIQDSKTRLEKVKELFSNLDLEDVNSVNALIAALLELDKSSHPTLGDSARDGLGCAFLKNPHRIKNLINNFERDGNFRRKGWIKGALAFHRLSSSLEPESSPKDTKDLSYVKYLKSILDVLLKLKDRGAYELCEKIFQEILELTDKEFIKSIEPYSPEKDQKSFLSDLIGPEYPVALTGKTISDQTVLNLFSQAVRRGSQIQDKTTNHEKLLITAAQLLHTYDNESYKSEAALSGILLHKADLDSMEGIIQFFEKNSPKETSFGKKFDINQAIWLVFKKLAEEAEEKDPASLLNLLNKYSPDLSSPDSCNLKVSALRGLISSFLFVNRFSDALEALKRAFSLIPDYEESPEENPLLKSFSQVYNQIAPFSSSQSTLETLLRIMEKNKEKIPPKQYKEKIEHLERNLENLKKPSFG